MIGRKTNANHYILTTYKAHISLADSEPNCQAGRNVKKAQKRVAKLAAMYIVCDMRGTKRILRWTIRVLAIAAGLYGGWLVAGALNDHRSDVPRPIPPIQNVNPH